MLFAKLNPIVAVELVTIYIFCRGEGVVAKDDDDSVNEFFFWVQLINPPLVNNMSNC